MVGTIDSAHKQATFRFVIARSTPLMTTAWNPVPAGDNYVLDWLDILFAPGHVALTGVRVRWMGGTLLPWAQPNSFILGDNERLRFDIGIPISNPVQVDQTNTDTVAHAHILTAQFSLDTPQQSLVNTALPEVTY